MEAEEMSSYIIAIITVLKLYYTLPILIPYLKPKSTLAHNKRKHFFLLRLAISLSDINFMVRVSFFGKEGAKNYLSFVVVLALQVLIWLLF